MPPRPLAKPRHIGLISDTHGLLRLEAVAALRDVELIIHAGDVGKIEVVDTLKELAPVVAVRGNIDKQAWAKDLPDTQMVEAANASLYVIHDLKELALDPKAAGIDFVISGHTHQPQQTQQDGVTYINPGAAGPRRFRLPISLAKLDLTTTPYTLTFLNLDPGGPSGTSALTVRI